MQNPFRSAGWAEAERWYAAWDTEQRSHETTRHHLVTLTTQLASLQRAGFSVAPPEPPAPPYTELDLEIRSALEGRFPENSPHRAMVLKQVDEWLLAGREPPWIARRIWDGEENVDD